MDFGCAACSQIVVVSQEYIDIVEAARLLCETDKCKKDGREIIEALKNSTDDVCHMFGYCMDSKHDLMTGRPSELSQSSRQLETNEPNSNLYLASGLDNWATYDNDFVCLLCAYYVEMLKKGELSVEEWTRDICKMNGITKEECDKHVENATKLINSDTTTHICQQWRLCKAPSFSEWVGQPQQV